MTHASHTALTECRVTDMTRDAEGFVVNTLTYAEFSLALICLCSLLEAVKIAALYVGASSLTSRRTYPVWSPCRYATVKFSEFLRSDELIT